VIFAGFGVLSAVKDARASRDTLVDIFERIEMFFRRLETYTQVPPTTEMMDIVIQIIVEVLSILGIATKEIRQGRLKKYAKKLVGRTEMEDALKKLDKLTQEARMAGAQNLKATYAVDERVKEVVDTVEAIDNRVADVNERVVTVDDRVKVVDNSLMQVIAGNKGIRTTNQNGTNYGRARTNGSSHRTPQPSTNHNIACDTHHKKAATWFFQGGIYQEWKSTVAALDPWKTWLGQKCYLFHGDSRC